MNPFIELVLGGNAAAARTCDWDCENRLIRVKPTPGTERDGLFKVEFAYDYLGRRIEKQVWTYGEAGWGTPTVRRFVYHGWRMLLEMDGNNHIVRKYTWGLDLAGLNGAVNSVGAAGGIGGLLAMQDPNDPNDPSDTFGDFVYLYDGNGNVGQLVDWSHDPNDPNGAIVAKYEYDPYGNIIAQSGTYADENPLRFSTKYYDAETGLSDFGHRYYHAGLGRWLSRDPIGELGGPNLYGFVGNSPVNYVDYLGYMWVDCPYGICRGNQGDCPGRPGGSTPRYPDRDGHAGGGGRSHGSPNRADEGGGKGHRWDIVDPWEAFGWGGVLGPDGWLFGTARARQAVFGPKYYYPGFFNGGTPWAWWNWFLRTGWSWYDYGAIRANLFALHGNWPGHWHYFLNHMPWRQPEAYGGAGIGIMGWVSGPATQAVLAVADAAVFYYIGDQIGEGPIGDGIGFVGGYVLVYGEEAWAYLGGLLDELGQSMAIAYSQRRPTYISIRGQLFRVMDCRHGCHPWDDRQPR